MIGQSEAIVIANSKFYLALSLADASAMRGQWVKSLKATCNHPGWHKLAGYDDIQQSWAAIFVNQGPMHIWPTETEVAFEGNLAWVTCIENIDATNTTANKIICVKAHNAFLETASGWKMLHHSAEAMPGHELQAANQRLASN